MRWGGFALVAGAFLVMFGLGGPRLIFGVWMRPLEADFQVDRSAISLVAAGVEPGRSPSQPALRGER